MKKLLCCLVVIMACFSVSKVNASNIFYDTRGTKYEGVVERMAKLGIVNGMTDTTYMPNKGLTRAELAKILTKIKGIEDYAKEVEYKKNFSDVKKSNWYYPYAMIASDLGLMNGYEDGTFKPNKEVSYAELVAILLRYLGYTDISEESSYGWYWNYITKMREIRLSDNTGAVDYTNSAKRGDVAIFIWNTLISDKWLGNDKTPLEVYFDEYGFLNDAVIDSIGGENEKIVIGIQGEKFYTSEKTPLHVLGGEITALYNIETNELIGVTFDQDYDNLEVVSGPEFYLKEEGYRPNTAQKVLCYGNRLASNYMYLVINKENNKIIRAIYVDASKSEIVDSVRVSNQNDETSKNETIKLRNISINGKEYSSENFVLVKDGFAQNLGSVQKGDVVTDLGNGLFVHSDEKITDVISDINYSDGKITVNKDEYIVSENCMCYLYKETVPVQYNTISSKNLKQYIGKEATITLNVAEEICAIKFGKTEVDNQNYKLGYITQTYYYDEEKMGIKIDFGGEMIIKTVTQPEANASFEIGQLVSIDDENKISVINKDIAFKNDISVKYNYDAKKMSYPMIGEYTVTKGTSYYKVNLKYKDNSITDIESCKIEEIYMDEDIEKLSAYTLVLIYDENMEVLKVYAVNEKNKYEEQIALVKNIQKASKDEKDRTFKVTLSVVSDTVKGYLVTKNLDKCIPGNIVTFTYTENDDNRTATIKEVFQKEFIGYKRDLVVKQFNQSSKTVTFTDNSTIQLDEDVYEWNGTKINLNKYRFVLAEVSKKDGEYEFTKLEIGEKEKMIFREGDRFAIGEMNDIIVIYRGYK